MQVYKRYRDTNYNELHNPINEKCVYDSHWYRKWIIKIQNVGTEIVKEISLRQINNECFSIIFVNPQIDKTEKSKVIQSQNKKHCGFCCVRYIYQNWLDIAWILTYIMSRLISVVKTIWVLFVLVDKLSARHWLCFCTRINNKPNKTTCLR